MSIICYGAMDKMFFGYFIVKGLKLYNNAEVPVGSDVRVDFSSLPRSTAVECEMSQNENWIPALYICHAIPPGPCLASNQYKDQNILIPPLFR